MEHVSKAQGGDVVRLNSGGPLMLVVRVEPGGGAFCAWAMPNGCMQFSHFDTRTLTVVAKGEA